MFARPHLQPGSETPGVRRGEALGKGTHPHVWQCQRVTLWSLPDRERRADGKNSPWTTVQKVLLMEGAPVVMGTTSSLSSLSLFLTGFLYYCLLLCNS